MFTSIPALYDLFNVEPANDAAALDAGRRVSAGTRRASSARAIADDARASGSTPRSSACGVIRTSRSQRRSVGVAAGASSARVTLARRSSRHAAGRGSAGSVVFHGVLYNERRFERVCTPAAPSIRSTICSRRSTRQHGVGFVERLEGEFCSGARRRAAAAAPARDRPDRQLPALLARRRRRACLRSDLSALLRAAPARARLDLRAVADYLTIGAVLGDKTLADGVAAPRSRHGPDLRPRDGRITLQPYVELAVVLRPDSATDRADYLDAVQAAFKRRRRPRADAARCRCGLSLSGGLDSRAILSAVERTGVGAPHVHAGRRGLRRSGDRRAARRASPAPSISIFALDEHVPPRLPAEHGARWCRSPTACT